MKEKCLNLLKKKQEVWLRWSCCWWFGVMWKRMYSREDVTYISNTKHLVFSIKHHDDTRGSVKTISIDPANFLKFSIANSLDFETIQNCSINIISKLCLGLKSFKAFVSDGSSKITGVVSGVATRLRENELKSQISIHWIYHQLTMLCVNGSTQLILLEVVKATVIQVRVFLKKPRLASKGPFSGLIQFLIIESPSKVIKNVLFFLLKALLDIEIFTFLFWTFGYTVKRIDKRATVSFKIKRHPLDKKQLHYTY